MKADDMKTIFHMFAIALAMFAFVTIANAMIENTHAFTSIINALS